MNRVIFFAVVSGGLFSLMWQLSPKTPWFWVVSLLCSLCVAYVKW